METECIKCKCWSCSTCARIPPYLIKALKSPTFGWTCEQYCLAEFPSLAKSAQSIETEMEGDNTSTLGEDNVGFY